MSTHTKILHVARISAPALALLALGASTEPVLAQLPQGTPSLAPMIERVSPAVVNISVSGSVEVDNPLGDDPLFRRFFQLPPDGRREFQSAGSGVIVDAQRGHILTNHHVIENAQDITITLLDNRSMHAQVIGSDMASDLAVLQIEPDNLTEMQLADSAVVKVGDFVVAIGNPFGFSHTVTSGIVSGLGRNNVNPDRNSYEDFIQTDASINPGNSGGALVDLNGRLVGINSAILSRSGGNIGIGFAIPVNMARNVMEQLVTFGAVSRGLLGVVIMSITPDLAEVYGLPDTSGALITDVTADSAAEQAGLLIDDVIVSINEEPVRDSGALRNSIGLLRPGENVRVGFIRDGRERSVTAVLNSLNANNRPLTPEPPPQLDPLFAGAELVPNEARGGVDGLLVARVEPDSDIAQRGLRNGDIITQINRQAVSTVADARAIVADAASVILRVQRGNRDLLILVR
jgi:serine protease Do/serine protease DegQ